MVLRSGLHVRTFVMGVIAMLALAACGAQPAAPASAVAVETTGADDFGAPEETELTVALPYPDTSFMAFMVAMEEGYFADEGLTIEELVTVDDTRAALVSDSADVAVVDAAGAYSAAAEDLPITVFAGNFCRQQYAFAAQPEIESVEDLSGQDVILSGAAGDTTEFEARKVLAEEGWSLEEVDVNPVYVGYDSATWAEFFAAGRVALTPFFSEDKPVLLEAGAEIIVDEIRPWPNNMMMAREDWVEENPNTARRFLRAMLRAVEFATAPGLGESPENWDAILDAAEEHGLEVDDLRSMPEEERLYVLGEYNLCTNLYYEEEAWNLSIENQELEPVPFEDGANIEALLAAQESLGLDNRAPEDIPWTPAGE